MSRTKELTKNTLIITAGRISTQFISFLLLPLYTTLLSTSEYGTVDFVITLVNLLIPVVSIMVDQGVFRFLLGCENKDDQIRVFSSSLLVMFLAGLVTTMIYAFASLFIGSEYKIWLILILLATALSNLFLQTARGLHRTADYALGSFVCSSVTIVLNVLCIAALKMGATGMLTATLLGNICCCLFLFLRLRIYEYIDFRKYDSKTAKEILRYSAPLVPHQLSLWVMNSSDRIIVTLILGTAANGVLAISHKFPAIFMTFYMMFQLAWHETGAVHFFDEDRDEFFARLINGIIMIFSVMCLAVIVFLPFVFDLLVKSAFAEAYNNIPIYLVASLCNVVVGLLGVVYVATKKTGEIAKTTIIAALINIIVNLLLIKHIGLYAASISTLAGYLTTMVYRIADTKKYLKINYDKKKISIMALMILFGCIIYYQKNITISLIALPVFVAVCYWMNGNIIKTAFKEILCRRRNSSES